MDDARTVVAEVEILPRALRKDRQATITRLERTRGDGQAGQIIAAWDYALETMTEQAVLKKTCSWTAEGIEDTGQGDFGGGDITLRRV